LKLALIAAVASNGVVGRDNQLPWRLPGDLQYFKRCTLGKPIVMGRKTWESLGRPLPGRPNIVVTRQPGYRAEGAYCVAGVEAALTLAEELAQASEADELMVIGGAEIYRAALPLAQRLYITEVHADVTGDTFFPDWNRKDWQEVSRQPQDAGETGQYDYSFVVYERA